MILDEPSARRVVLVQAIESVDSEGRLIGPAEIDRTESELLGAAAMPAEQPQAPTATLLVERADRLLAHVAAREPEIAALAQPSGASGWLLWGLPVLTLLLGLTTDRIADPHKVDLLSQPLLAIVLWNLAMYLVLLAGALRPGRQVRPGMSEELRRWFEGLRLRGAGGRFRREIRLVFARLWHPVSATVNRWRVVRMLHLAAAGWAAGVALSLIARGAVVEYHVGWESTWFDAAQVHAFLDVLLMPAVALLGVAPLSLQEVAQLEISRNSVAEAGRRWVYLYATLLAVVVIVPRLLLAAYARWRELHAARSVELHAQQPYFEAVVARLRPARVRLALRTDTREDRLALLQVLLPGQADRPPAPAAGPSRPLVLAQAGKGDLLQLVELPAAEPLQLAAPRRAGSGLVALVRRAWAPAPVARDAAVLQAGAGEGGDSAPIDLVVQVVSAAAHLGATRMLRRDFARPVLLLVRPAGTGSEVEALLAACRQAVGEDGVELLHFGEFARCWVQEEVLLDAIGGHLAADKAPGFARLRQAWMHRHRQRLGQAMATVALQLVEAAREGEEVRAPALSLRDILPAERRAGDQARKQATARVVERLQRSAELTTTRLLELHGIDPGEARPLEMQLEEKFVVQGAVNTPQAGLAGAATGAAMGASVDLMVGGLTLGAAAALGALVGGGAATVAAAWKNKSTGAVTSAVAPGDDMLEGLTEAALLRYLAVAHFGRLDAGAGEPELRWKEEVAAVVGRQRERLKALWVSARTAPEGGARGAPATDAGPSDSVTAQLSELLTGMATELLARLYPRAAGDADRT